MERCPEEAPKVLEDHLGRRLSSTVRNTLCPDSFCGFAGTRARTRLTEAVRSLHPPSSTICWCFIKAHASGSRLLSKTVYATLALRNTIGCVSQQARVLHVMVASLHVHWGDST